MDISNLSKAEIQDVFDKIEAVYELRNDPDYKFFNSRSAANWDACEAIAFILNIKTRVDQTNIHKWRYPFLSKLRKMGVITK